MGNVVALAKAMRDGMDVADESPGKSPAGEVGSAEHGFARFDVCTFRARCPEVGEDETHGLYGLGIDIRIMERVGVGFNGVGEGVDSRGGG